MADSGGYDDSEEDDLADQIERMLSLQSNPKGDGQKGLKEFATWIESGQIKNILVLCGAGVSVSAGIPDFRTPGTGLYDNLQKYNLRRPEDIFDIHYYRHSPQAFVTLAHELWPGFKHSPTLTHSFLKLLSDKGLLLRNYTQNIDGLDHLAGVPGDKLLECHGHFRTASCVDCKKSAPILTVQQAMVERNEVPKCDSCGGNVKPDIVFFGEQLPSRFYQLFQDDIRKADCLLILGTSLQVAPVSAIPQMVCCPRVLFNREYVLQPTSSGHGSKKKKNSRGGKQQPPQDIYVEGDCDATVLELSEILGWDEELKKQHAKTQLVRPKAGGGGGSSSSSSSPTKAATKKNIDECNAKKKTSR